MNKREQIRNLLVQLSQLTKKAGFLTPDGRLLEFKVKGETKKSKRSLA